MIGPLTSVVLALATTNLAEPSWSNPTLVIDYLGTTRGNDRTSILMPEDVNGPSAMFTCDQGKYRVWISLRRGEHRKVLAEANWRRFREREGTIFVDGEATWTGQVLYQPADQLARPTKRKPAAQVFNAVIRGQSVSFKMGRQTHGLELPPVDDSFRKFARNCSELND